MFILLINVFFEWPEKGADGVLAWRSWSTYPWLAEHRGGGWGGGAVNKTTFDIDLVLKERERTVNLIKSWPMCSSLQCCEEGWVFHIKGMSERNIVIWDFIFIFGCPGSSLLRVDIIAVSWGNCLDAVHGLLIAMASFVSEHGLYAHRLQ